MTPFAVVKKNGKNLQHLYAYMQFDIEILGFNYFLIQSW